MAGNINNVIEKEQIVGDIQAVIDKILKLEDEIANTNAKSISITVDLKGAETISDLTAAVNEQRQAMAELIKIQNDNKATTQQLQLINTTYGQGVTNNIEALVENKLALAQVTETLKANIKETQNGKVATESQIAAIEKGTQAQMELKQQVADTTSALKSQIKEAQAAKGSMDEMSQTLFQLKERYRALSAEERTAAEVGGKLNAQITQLDAEVKRLDATIGNNQRNVGNYKDGFKNVGAELTYVRTEMQKLVVAGEKSSAEYAKLTARAGELAAAQREVASETGRAMFSLENIGNRLERMGFRMLLHMVVFTAIIGTVIALIDWIEKLTDAEQKAADGIKEMDDAQKSFDDTVRKSRGEMTAAIRTETEALENLLTVYMRTTYGTDLRVAAYSKLQAAYSEILPALTEEEIKTKKISEAHEAAIDKLKQYVDLKQKYAAGEKLIKASIDKQESDKTTISTLDETLTPKGRNAVDFLNANPSASNIQIRRANDRGGGRTTSTDLDQARAYVKALQDIQTQESFIALTKKFQVDRQEELLQFGIQEKEIHEGRIREDIEEDIRKQTYLKDTTAANTDAHNSALANLKVLKKELEDYDGKEKKDTTKKDARKEMADRLKLVKDEETAKMLAAQKTYDESKKTFVEERQLEADKIAVAKDAYTKRTEIVNEFRVKAKLSDTEYKDHLTTSKNDENEIILKANEVTKKIDDEIHKRHEQADADSIKYIDGLKKQRAEIEKLTTDLENLKATNAIELRGAGFHLFGDEASNFNTQRDILKQKISESKQAAGAAVDNIGDEYSKNDLPSGIGSGADLNKILKFTAEKKKAEEDGIKSSHELAMLEADQKKKVQEEIRDKTIQLAKETMQAVITIQENQFAKEAQMLAIKQQKEQTAYDQKKEAIAATAGYAIDKDNQLSKLAAQHAAAQNEIQQEQNQLALRKAKFEKEAGMAQIAVSIATAEAQALTLLGNVATAPFYPAVASLIAATGAVELAAASSAPLPQFFKGGVTETPIFTAGERGREMMVTPSGEISLTPSTTTVYKAPIGTRIFNNDDTERMIKYASNHVTSSTSQSMPVITVQGMDDKKIVAKLEDVAETIVSGVFAARTPATNMNVIADAMRAQQNLRR